MIMSNTELREWVRTAEAGDYLVKYADSGLSDAEDPGYRCGYDDPTLDQLATWLAERDLRLIADDIGLCAEVRR